MAAKILVVDDEHAIADLVDIYVKNENYHVLSGRCRKAIVKERG